MKIKRVIWAGIGVLAVVGAALWMRELASWRPVLIGEVRTAGDYRRLQLSPDERFLVAGERAILDLRTGKAAPDVPARDDFYGLADSHSYFCARLDPQRGRNYISYYYRRDLASGRILWSNRDLNATIEDFPLAFLLAPHARKTLILTRTALKTFDERGKLLSRHSLVRTRDGFGAGNGFLTPRGDLIRAGGFDLTSRDTTTWRVGWRRHDKPFGMGAITSDGRTLWVAAHGVAHFLDAATGKELWQRPLTSIQADGMPPKGFGFSGDSRVVALLDEMRVDFVNVRTGQLLGSKHGRDIRHFAGTAPTGDGNFLYTTDYRGKIWRWRLK